MVSLIDADETPGNLERVKKELSEAVQLRSLSDDTNENVDSGTGQPAHRRTVEINDDELPENLRGKSYMEVVGLLRESQSTIGRMANDLGTQRKLTDRLLDLKRESDLGRNGAPEAPKLTANDVLDNPTDSIGRVVEARVTRAQEVTAERLAQLEAQIQAQAFLTKHGDWTSVTQEAGFTAFVQATPYRARLAEQARSGNWSAADELLSEYKDRKSAMTARGTKMKDDNVEAARSASLESGSGERSARGKSMGKIFRRTDLLKLQIEDPESYYDDGFQREIILAYQEGRVK